VPIYEYVCKKCSHPFEELVFGGEEPPCPRCSAIEVERVLSVVAIGHAQGGGASASAPRGEAPCGGGACGGGGCPFAS
jgi:putative FmdB family regulatory protein